MKNIVIISMSNYTNYPFGGEVVLLNNFLKTIDTKKHCIKLVGLSHDSEERAGKWFTKEINDKSYEFLPVFCELKEKENTILPFRVRMCFGIIKNLKNINLRNVDYVYIQWPEFVIAFFLLKKIKKIKIIYHVHCHPNLTLNMSRFNMARNNLLSHFYNGIVNLCIKYSDLVIWSSNRAKFEYSTDKYKKYIGKYVTIHSSYDNSLESKGNHDKYEFNVKLRYIIYVGRLSKIKGLNLILESLIYFKNDNNIKLLLCGDGEEKEELIRYSQELGIFHMVDFVGFVNREDLGFYLNNSEVFVFSSFSETFSLVVLEALSMGLPIVSTDVGDLSEVVIDEQTGYLIKEREPKTFYNAIKQILDNGKDHYSENCINIVKKYTPKKMSQEILEAIYNIDKS